MIKQLRAAIAKLELKWSPEDILKEHLHDKNLIWVQYTPSFNDGSPCRFELCDEMVITPMSIQDLEDLFKRLKPRERDLVYWAQWSFWDDCDNPEEKEHLRNLHEKLYVEFRGATDAIYGEFASYPDRMEYLLGNSWCFWDHKKQEIITREYYP